MTDQSERPPDRLCATCNQVKPAGEFAGERDHCRDCERAEAEYRAEIDRRLDAIRPKRAAISDRDWREPVYTWARNHMPNETNLVRRQAQRDVDRRERDATHRGNGKLRDWQIGTMPLFIWTDVGPTPIRVGDDHVRLDAVTIRDGRQFARETRTSAKRTYDSQLLVATAIEEMCDLATEKGCLLLAELGDLPAPGVDDAAVGT